MFSFGRRSELPNTSDLQCKMHRDETTPPPRRADGVRDCRRRCSLTSAHRTRARRHSSCALPVLADVQRPFANRQARTVVVQPRHQVSTRYGDVAARLYVPDGTSRRTVLLVPGIHSMGIEEPRLTALADDLAGAGVKVMAMALPDLQAYRITPRATDVIEDAVTWMSMRPDLAPDGRVGIVGISFAGGLSISAASRPAIRDKVAFVLSFGGHGDLESCHALSHYRRGASGAWARNPSSARLWGRGDSLCTGRSRTRAGRSSRARCAKASKRFCSRRN